MRVSRLIASGLGTGYAPAAPGTAGSALGLALGVALLAAAPAWLAAGTVLATIAGLAAIPPATGMELSGSPHGGHDDPGWVVIDEIAGQMLALLALAQPGDRRVRQHVRDGLTADWLEVQLVAARAMGMLGSDEGYAIAAKAAGSSDARQRFMAATALGAIGRPDSQPILRRLLADDYESVRIAAAQAILELKAT